MCIYSGFHTICKKCRGGGGLVSRRRAGYTVTVHAEIVRGQKLQKTRKRSEAVRAGRWPLAIVGALPGLLGGCGEEVLRVSYEEIRAECERAAEVIASENAVTATCLPEQGIEVLHPLTGELLKTFGWQSIAEAALYNKCRDSGRDDCRVPE